MKLIFALHCICLIATFADAQIPLPQLGEPQDHLLPRCRIPKCPEVKTAEDRERVVALPYPTDCLQFVECKGSEARIRACPPDEIFDKTISSCGPRNKVHCVPCYAETTQN